MAKPACRQAGGIRVQQMYYVNVLFSLKNRNFYKGITNNIDRRLNEHLTGRSRYTKKILPVKLVHVEICDSRIEARRLELLFKSGYGREILKELFDAA